MNQKIMKLIAVFLIGLVVSLPFYSSSALVRAASPTGVELVKVYGSDNIEGYARPGETVTVEANIYTGSEVKADDVLIGSSKFQTCTPKYSGVTATLYYCRYTGLSTVGLSTTAPNPITVSVSGTAYSESTNLIIDSQAPQIIFGVEEQVIGAGESTFNYRITDTSCTGSACAGKCPGIKKILLYDEEDGVSSGQVFNPPITDINNCEASGTIRWEPVTQTKDVRVCAKAYDMLDWESVGQSCVTFHKDITGPEASQLQIIRNNVPVEWVGPSGIFADVIARLPVDVNTARADLSQLNNDLSYANRVGACVKNEADGYTECTWSNVLLRVTANKQGTVVITATDSSGNTKDTSLSFSLKYDGTVPVVDFFGTTKFYDDVSYAKADHNTFLIRFTETESGFHDKNVFIDLSELNSGYGTTQADECRQESGKWVCYWNDISVTAAHGATKKAALQDGTSDDAGNLVHTVTIASVKVDKTPPTITKLTKRVDEAVDACPTSGEVLTFDVEGEEDSDRLSLKINASLISEHQDLIEEECVKQTDEWVCSIGVDQLYSNYRNKNVKIILEDIAGNTAEQNVQTEICEADTTTASDHLNFITFTPETPPTIPGQIDRKLASKIPASVYIPLQFAANGATFSIIRDDNCAGTEWIDGEPFIINQYSDEPMLALKLKRADYSSVDKIAVNCSVYLRVRKGHKVYANPEIEPVNIDALLYNLPLGQPGENMRAEMTKTINEINGVTKEINDLKKKNKWLKSVCKLLEVLGKVQHTINLLLGTIQSATCIASFIPTLKPSAESTWSNSCRSIEKVSTGINKLLDNKITSGLKLMCMQYSCRLCNPEALAQFTLSPFESYFDKIKIGDNQVFQDFSGVWVEQGSSGEPTIYLNNQNEQDVKNMGFEYNPKIGKWECKDPGKGCTPGFTVTKGSSVSFPATSLFGNVFSGGGKKPEFDPFHDINAANACWCTPAKIFNKKKLRQIKCMYYKCLEQHATLGLSPHTCSIAYAERSCLYYEGANAKKSNLFTQMLKQLPLQLFYNLLNGILNNFLHCTRGCNTEACAAGLPGGDVWCGILHAANFVNGVQQISEFKFPSFNQDDPKLAGPDYCEGISGVDPLE